MASITDLYPTGFNASHYDVEVVNSSSIDDFRNAMLDAALITEHINSDGNIHRVATRDDRGTKKTGWYVYFDDVECPAGAFGDWRSGLQQTWTSKNYEKLSAEKQHEHRQRMDQIKKLREIEQAKEYDQAAKKANKIWKSSKQPKVDHDYLLKKGIKAKSIRCMTDGRLVVPLYNDKNKIRSIQFIATDGFKKFLTGGKVAGNSLTLNGSSHTIYVCEGYATGVTICEATQAKTVVAFNSNNLKSVAQTVRDQHSNSRIIIAADNDQFTDGNPGVTKATEAAQVVGAKIVAPVFIDLSTKPTDFNDLAQLSGMDEVKRQIDHQPPLSTVVASMAGKPIKEIEWLLEGVLSVGAPAMIFARGGAGKSLFVQHLSACVSKGVDFFGKKVKKGPVMSVWCEDDIDEMHRRQTAICDVHGIEYESLTDMHVINRIGEHNNFLITFDGKDVGQVTDFYHQLDAEMQRIKPVFMTIDNAGDVYPGSENDKSQVNQFLKGVIGKLSNKHNCSILIIGHTPKSEAEFAGNMAWENSVRHRIFIEHDKDTGIRNVKLSKTNRGKEGDLFTLYWDRGCLVEMVDSSFVEHAKKDILIKQTLKLIDTLYERKTNINLSKFGSYAPKELASLGQRKSINWTQEDYESIIEKLLDDGHIELVSGHNRGASQTLKTTDKNFVGGST